MSDLEGRSAPDAYGGVTVASVLLHYRAEGNVKNGVPLVSDNQKLIKPVRISVAWKRNRAEDRWALVVVKVTGPRLSMDQRGTVPGSERHASWHENDLALAPEWVQRFVDHNSPEVTDAKRP